MQRVDLVKGPAEQLVAFIRQPCDQIHMDMHIAKRDQTLQIVQHRIDIFLAVDGCQCRRIGRLNPRLNLKQSLAGGPKECQCRVIQ